MTTSIRAIAAAHDLSEAVVSELEALWSSRSMLTGQSITSGAAGAEATMHAGAFAEDEPPSAFSSVDDSRYEDLGLIGRGGMGEVRRVRDRALDRTLAVKILHAPLLTEPGAFSRFVAEARATARLEHPGIVPIHDLGQTPDGRPWFTMKEVSGATFAERLRRPRTDASLGEDIAVFLAICQTIAFAHSHGVIHRDLKPANVMIGDFGQVYVLDWGLALLDTGRRGEGVVAGTPSYMAPEQALGEVARIDARTDVYALGAILYEVLAGRPPYTGHARDVVAAVIAGPPPPPEPPEGAPHARADGLVDACVRAMSRRPEHRHASAEALAGEIRGWLDGTQRRAQARALVRRASETDAEARALRARAAEQAEQSTALLSGVAAWEHEDRKAPGWARAAEAAATTSLAAQRDAEAENALHTALQLAPDLAEAHAALIERHRHAHEGAEARRDTLAAATERIVLEAHLDALPRAHPLRASTSAYLRGHGALTLVTDPPGAEVLLYRYEPHNRRLVPVFQRSLGRTPLLSVDLPMGSYLCVLRAEGRAEVRYPVEIGRLRHWDGVAPGEHTPTSVWLPPAHLLGPDEVYVPAGWFRAGGDPEIPESGVETRLWVDAFVMDRDPVTNIAYLEYLNDLVAQGRTEEALLHAPRERSGVVARAGPLVYGFEDGRFFLVPDGEGDMWAPDWPVLQVDWHGARAFLEWRAARTGRPWRQPAAAEREKAARGVDGRWHPWGDAFDPSWCCMSDGHRGRRMPAPVGAHAFDESTYGVRGLAGNVADWCVDPVDAPRMPNGARLVLPEPSATDGAHRDDRPRVFHGGAWSAYARGSRAAHRNRAGASVRLQYLGLRGVWSMDALRGG